MKIFVTGALGQVGSEIVAEAKEAGFEVAEYGRSNLDIADSNMVTNTIKKEKPDIVINAAAYTAVDMAENDVRQAYNVNRDGVNNLAKVCQSLAIPLFHISTDYVFDGDSGEPYSETDEANPVNVYGDSKLQGDQCVQEIDKYIVLRVSWVFGGVGNNFVKTMLNLANRDSLTIVSDQIGAPTWSKHIAETLIKIAIQYKGRKELEWGVYHYCGSFSLSWYDFAKQIFHSAKLLKLIDREPILQEVKTDEYQYDAKRPLFTVLDCKKINQVFAIQQPDWKVGLLAIMNGLDKIET
jgi:dTDP-4-dehydrorhamnose reductase